MEDIEQRQKEFLQKKLDYQRQAALEKEKEREDEENKQKDEQNEEESKVNFSFQQSDVAIFEENQIAQQTKPQMIGFYKLNYHIRKYILGFITFKQLKYMMYICKQMHQDILSYFRTHLSKLHVSDTIRFENDGYQKFFTNYGQNLTHLSIFCQGLDYIDLINCLPDGKLVGVKLIMCPSFWLQKRQFYRLLKHKLSRSLQSIQIQVYTQINYNNKQSEELSLTHSGSKQTKMSDGSGSKRQNSQSAFEKPVTLEFLKSFWSSFKMLRKISMKEMQTILDLSLDYILLIESIFTTPTLNLKALKIQNMIIPFSLFQNLTFKNQSNHSNFNINDPQHSLQFISDNNSLFNQNFHSLPNPNSLQFIQNPAQLPDSSNNQQNQLQHSLNLNMHSSQQQFQDQISSLNQQRQLLVEQQWQQQLQSNEQTMRLQNQIQQLDKQIKDLQQISETQNRNMNHSQQNEEANITTPTRESMASEYIDIEDTISFGEREIFNGDTLNQFSKLETLKIVSTRNSINFMGINDPTLECLIKLFPKTLNRIEILDYQSEANSALREKSFSERLFVDFIHHFSGLTKLSINCYKTRQQISNFAFLHMTQIYNNLVTLGLASCNGINSGVLNLLISRNCPQLQELCMDYTQLEGALDMIVQTSTAQLKRISINYCKRITKQEIISFCSGQNQLETISFKQIKCFTKKALIPLIHNNYKTLKSIILEGNKIDNTHIAYLLRYCRQLQSLAIRKMDRVDANFSNQLFHTILQFAERENYSKIHEKLTYLDISYNQTFNDDSISCVHQLFPNLYTFTLDSCSITSLKSLLPLKSTLNSLNLSGNLIIIKLESDFEQICQVLQQFSYLNTIYIEIPNIDRFLKHSNFIWNAKPIIIKESYNMCCYSITRDYYA